MKLKKRLKLYRLALHEYELANEESEMYKASKNLDCGLCYYFSSQLHYDISTFKEFIKMAKKLNKSPDEYWFPRAETEPRIKILKKFIKQCKKKLDARLL